MAVCEVVELLGGDRRERSTWLDWRKWARRSFFALLRCIRSTLSRIYESNFGKRHESSE
jgi:hypothetical protein